MKKVALLSLLLSLLAQLPAPAQYRADLSGVSRTSQKRFADILNRDEKPIRGKRKKQPVNADTGYQPLPDYERPAHLIEMSIRVAGNLNVNTVEASGDYARFSPNGVGLRWSVGPTLDYFFFKDRYALSSGLWFTIKRSGYQMPGSFGQSRFDPASPDQQSVYNLQYLQVPVSVKLFANQIAPQLRLYVQCGGLLSLKIAEHAQDPTRNGLYRYAESSGNDRQYGFGDVELLLGAGVQYKLNDVNALNLGLSYQRGLLDVARGSELTSKMRTVAVEVGFKF